MTYIALDLRWLRASLHLGNHLASFSISHLIVLKFYQLLHQSNLWQRLRPIAALALGSPRVNGQDVADRINMVVRIYRNTAV